MNINGPKNQEEADFVFGFINDELQKEISKTLGVEIVIPEKIKSKNKNLFRKFYLFSLDYSFEEVKIMFGGLGYDIQIRPYDHINLIKEKIKNGLEKGIIILFLDIDNKDNIIIVEEKEFTSFIEFYSARILRFLYL